MKLYLSSYHIPTPDDLATLLGKPLAATSAALIPNAQDYYARHAWEYKVSVMTDYMQSLGLHVDVVDLQEYSNPDALKQRLGSYDLIWSMGGNTYVLRQAMRRSGFETIIRELVDSGIVYGGDSAGALVAGPSIAGVETADEPEFAQEVIEEGLRLTSFAILPHIDNPEFAEVVPIFRQIHPTKDTIELKDPQAVIFTDDTHILVESRTSAANQ